MMSAALSSAAAVTLHRGPGGRCDEEGHDVGRAPKLAQTGHATFWNCPSKTTLLLVVVNPLTLHPGATLDVSFTVRNGAKTPCNYTAPYTGVAPAHLRHAEGRAVRLGELPDRGCAWPQRVARQ